MEAISIAHTPHTAPSVYAHMATTILKVSFLDQQLPLYCQFLKVLPNCRHDVTKSIKAITCETQDLPEQYLSFICYGMSCSSNQNKP